MYVETSGYVPWKDYAVKGWWVDELWTQNKLNHERYLQYAAKVRIGFITRKKQVETVQEYERAANLKLRQTAVSRRLVTLKNRFKPQVLQQLVPWSAQYVTDQLRYKFLVLRGGSRAGKSTLAKALGDPDVFNFGMPYVQTVQNATSPNLREFDNDKYGFIVFDNVNNMDFVLAHRAMIQANNDIHLLGESQTGIYAYSVWLFMVPIVITVDTSAKWRSHEPWIRENCIEICLDGPCYLPLPPVQ